MSRIIVWWLKINEEEDSLERVETCFENMEESNAFFEAEIQTGLVYDVEAIIEGNTQEEYDAFAALRAEFAEYETLENGFIPAKEAA